MFKSLQNILHEYLYANMYLVDMTVMSENVRNKFINYMALLCYDKDVVCVRRNLFLGLMYKFYKMKTVVDDGKIKFITHFAGYRTNEFTIEYSETYLYNLNQFGFKSLTTSYVTKLEDYSIFVKDDKVILLIPIEDKQPLYFTVDNRALEILKDLQSRVKVSLYSIHKRGKVTALRPKRNNLENICVDTLGRNPQYVNMRVGDGLLISIVNSICYHKVNPTRRYFFISKGNLHSILYYLHKDGKGKIKDNILVLKNNNINYKEVKLPAFDSIGLKVCECGKLDQSDFSPDEKKSITRLTTEHRQIIIDYDNDRFITLINKPYSRSNEIDLKDCYVVLATGYAMELHRKYYRIGDETIISRIIDI